ncbi:hypothetical protein AB6A40_007692 [Gnathostoma spinigerum]|uniref:26S proteasome non-ATPase regulatory subunit 4 n=1 Tax=Gnathostoma spinigerum TaxID=75299 RepID=A0ABD6EV99_9BILA
MVQESTMICLDNSNWMRNGDFTPTRLQCQQDAANLILRCKLRQNAENAVGVLSMAETVEVLSTMTQDVAKLFMKIHQVEPKGTSNFINGIKIAHLALKHRQNHHHKMRIVLFIGSPIDHLDRNEMIRLAKKLKKEKVQVDVICFGEAAQNNSTLFAEFVDTIRGGTWTGSHFITVSYRKTLTEALLNSPICCGDDGAAPLSVAPGSGGFEFGIDPEDDPDLALALRVSLEEQRQRQQQEAASGGASDAANENPPATGRQPEAMETSTQDVMNMDPAAMTEQQQLEWALRMSMQEDNSASGGSATQPGASDHAVESCDDKAGAGKDAMKKTDDAMEVDSTSVTKNDAPSGDDQLGQLVNSPELLRQLVADLPGVASSTQGTEGAAEAEKETKKSETERKE